MWDSLSQGQLKIIFFFSSREAFQKVILKKSVQKNKLQNPVSEISSSDSIYNMKNNLITINKNHIAKLMTASLFITLFYFLPWTRDTVDHISGIIFDKKRCPESMTEKKNSSKLQFQTTAHILGITKHEVQLLLILCYALSIALCELLFYIYLCFDSYSTSQREKIFEVINFLIKSSQLQ